MKRIDSWYWCGETAVFVTAKIDDTIRVIVDNQSSWGFAELIEGQSWGVGPFRMPVFEGLVWGAGLRDKLEGRVWGSGIIPGPLE